MELLEIAARIEAYNPAVSADNRADELALHQDIVMETGLGTLSPDFELTFVRSLDAALQLVPEGWAFSLGRCDDGVTCWAGCSDSDMHMASQDTEEGYFEGDAATPALALTAACLKARAAQAGAS